MTLSADSKFHELCPSHDLKVCTVVVSVHESPERFWFS